MFPDLPRKFRDNAVITLTGERRPRGVRMYLGPVAAVLPDERFEHFVALLAGIQDPNDIPANESLDFRDYNSALRQDGRLRATFCRMRDAFEAAFSADSGDESDAALARNIVLSPPFERRTQIVGPIGLRITKEFWQLPDDIVRREIKDRLKRKYGEEGNSNGI